MKRLILIVSILMITACNQQEAQVSSSIRVSAASSLTTVMKEIKRQYEKKYPDHSLTIQYASSGTLAHQLIQGAPSNLYISANERWMEEVVQEGLMDASDVQPVVRNRLILATHTGEKLQVDDLLSLPQFAMGDPNSVPAGAYAKQALQSHGIWEQVKDKAVFGKNVRQVASYIQSQNVQAAFVYQSDVQAIQGVETSEVVSESTHDSISYPMGVMKDSRNNKVVQQFVDYMMSSEAKKVFRSHGFVPVE